MTNPFRGALALSALLLLVSCGGGDDGGAGPGLDTTPASIVLTPEIDTILVGGSAGLTAQVENAAGDVVSATITWSSSNPALASVSSAGLVQSVLPGIVWIRASAGTLSDSTRIYLAPIVTVTRRLPSLFAGDTTLLHGAFSRLGGAGVAPSDSTFWSSSDPAVATVTQAGVVSGVTAGTAVIRLSSSGSRDSQVVVVLPKNPRPNREIAYLREVVRQVDGAHVVGLFVSNPDGSNEVAIAPANSYVLEYHWSSSGHRLVLWHGQYNGFGETGFSLVNADGSNRVPLPIEARSARFSPDDSRIVYHQGEGTGVVVTVANADGSNAHALTTSGGENEVNPEWSPDGRQVAYREEPRKRLWVMDADGGNKRELVATDAGNLKWSPDGKEISYLKGSGVWLVNVETAISRPLSPNCTGTACVSPSHEAVAWRFDGGRVAMGNAQGFGEITVADRDGANPLPIDLGPATPGSHLETNPSWSPNGELIAATGSANDSIDFNITRIKIMNANGTGQVPGPLGYGVQWRP